MQIVYTFRQVIILRPIESFNIFPKRNIVIVLSSYNEYSHLFLNVLLHLKDSVDGNLKQKGYVSELH